MKPKTEKCSMLANKQDKKSLDSFLFAVRISYEIFFCWVSIFFLAEKCDLHMELFTVRLSIQPIFRCTAFLPSHAFMHYLELHWIWLCAKVLIPHSFHSVLLFHFPLAHSFSNQINLHVFGCPDCNQYRKEATEISTKQTEKKNLHVIFFKSIQIPSHVHTNTFFLSLQCWIVKIVPHGGIFILASIYGTEY